MILKIGHLRDSIGQQRAFLESHVALSQAKDISKLRTESLTEFIRLQDLRISARIAFQRARRAEEDRRRDIVQQWLGGIDSWTRHQDAVKARHVGTGNWLLADERFKQWSNLNHCVDPLLWLKGMPGAGSLANLFFLFFSLG
jgi:hypothetical protein